jgi:GT2 family glycosyltransferase
MIRPDDVTVIIPQRGGADLTRQCLAGLFQHEPDIGEILVVDDGSPDGSADKVEQFAPGPVTVLRAEPQGVTAAWNRGLSAATKRWVILLNNDVLIHGPWLEKLLQLLRDGTAMIAGARWRTERMLPQSLLLQSPATQLLEGWCLALARETWQRLGGFESSLRLYWSDTDFQWRAVQHYGDSALHAVDNLPLEHLGHSTTRQSSDREALWRADRQRFIEIWRRAGSRLPDCALKSGGTP